MQATAASTAQREKLSILIRPYKDVFVDLACGGCGEERSRPRSKMDIGIPFLEIPKYFACSQFCVVSCERLWF
jgi:hypothetical protein